MNREPESPLAVEILGWLGFVLFVAGVWRVRKALDRPHP